MKKYDFGGIASMKSCQIRNFGILFSYFLIFLLIFNLKTQKKKRGRREESGITCFYV